MDLIKIKGGSGDVSALQDRELAYRRDEKALYIGTKDGNVRLCGANDAVEVGEIIKIIAGLQGQVSSMSEAIENITARLDALTPSE